MLCPHCHLGIHEDWRASYLGKDVDTSHAIYVMTCPECDRFIITHIAGEASFYAGGGQPQSFANIHRPLFDRTIYPFGATRPVPEQVPPDLASE